MAQHEGVFSANLVGTSTASVPAPLTAKEVRALLPVVHLDEVLVKITRKIAEAARAGKLTLDIQDQMPKMAGWDITRANAMRHDIFGGLRALGYTVKPFAGGHSDGANVIVGWAD